MENERSNSVLASLNKCNKLLEQGPMSMSLLMLRSLLYNSSHQTDMAIQDITTVINEDPQNAKAYYARCCYHLNNQNYDLAKRDYMRGLNFQRKFGTVPLVLMFTEEQISKAVMASNEELADIIRVVKEETKDLMNNLYPQLD